MTVRLEDFIKASRILKEIQYPQNRIMMVIGMSDTGKTVLTECLSDHLSKRTEVGIVDLDMGQSHISLPTAIAWGKIKEGFKSWQSIKVEDFYFTGALSPVGSLLPAVTGAKLITDKAVASCKKVVIDTTGLTSEPVGRVLKQFKIDILFPDIILALEYSGELGHILDGFKSQKSPQICILPVPDRVGSKSPAKRRRHRIERFRSYFTGAQTHEVSLENTGIRFTGRPSRLTNAELKNRTVSFRNDENRDIALGLIIEVHQRHRKILVKSPIHKDMKFSTMMIGTARIEL